MKTLVLIILQPESVFCVLTIEIIGMKAKKNLKQNSKMENGPVHVTKTYHKFSMYPVCLITVSCVCLDSQYRRQFIVVMYRERMYESLFENIPLTSQIFSPVGCGTELLVVVVLYYYSEFPSVSHKHDTAMSVCKLKTNKVTCVHVVHCSFTFHMVLHTFQLMFARDLLYGRRALSSLPCV
jgi:hypothetical protein